MKRTLSYSLALVLALCAFSAPPARAQIGTTCTITGTVYQVDGVTPAAGATLTVTRADKAGKLYANTSRVYSTNSNGIVSFKVPRTVGTDTAVIHVKASFGNLAAGQILYVPSDSTATLESLVRYTANPTFVVVAVPTSVNDSTQTIFDPSGTQKIPASRLDVGAITGDTTGTTNQPMQGRFENMLGQFTASTSDSLQQTAANVFVARNVAEGKADADSVKLAFDRLGDRADADSLAGVKTTADGAVQRADTNALHAQKFAIIDNRLGDRADADSLASVKGTADAALPKADTSALHAQKFQIVDNRLGDRADADSLASVKTTADAALPKTDSTRFVSRTAPQIPGLASADTNTVIGVDASGNLVLRKDDSGGGAAIDSTTLFVERFAWQRGTLSITPIRPGDTLRVTSIAHTSWAQPVRFGPEIQTRYAGVFGNMFIGKWNLDTSYTVLAHMNQNGGSAYAFIQQNNGTTYFNSMGTLWFNINAAGKMQMTANELVSRANNDLALGTRTLQWRELWVQGRGFFDDTLRVGRYTTYSYIRPGDANWTASSTVDVKRDIAPTDTVSATDTRSILARVASVDPVRYRFRPQVFRVPFDTAFAGGKWWTMKLAERQTFRENYRITDSLRAVEKAAGYLTGFLAEQFNAAFGDPNSKEISYSDVVAVEWRAIQALIRRTRLQEQRIDALEETIRQMDARLKAGGL